MHSCTRMDTFGNWMDIFCTQMVHICTQMDVQFYFLLSRIVFFLLPCPLLCQSETSVLFRHLSRAVHACIHSSFCHSVAPSLLYHFIPICVFCECLSLAFASSMVSVSSLIQALSSILYIAFMVQLV